MVIGVGEFCGPAPLAPPPIGLEIAEAGVIPVVAIGLEMAEAGVIPVVPIGLEAGVIPGIGAPVVCGPITLVSPGNGVLVAVGPVMVTPGIFVFPALPFAAGPGVVRSGEPDIGTAEAGVPRALLPLCTGRPVAGLAFVSEPPEGLPLTEAPLTLLGLLLTGLRAVGEPLEPFDCATIQDAAVRMKIKSAVLGFMVTSKTLCLIVQAKAAS